MSDVETVLRLAQRGWYVFPLRGKEPALAQSWKAIATTDVEQLVARYAGTSYDVGIACGPSRLLVVDEDTPSGFAKFAASVGEIVPKTYTVQTGNGSHFYFDATGLPELSNQAGALQHYGCDVRGAGGYVVGAGSLHSSGARYVELDDREPVPVPQWLVAALSTRVNGSVHSLSAEPFAELGIAALPDVIAAPSGGGGQRHQTLVRYAASLRSRNVPQTEASLLFRHAWQRCEQPPGDKLDWIEAEGILLDIYRTMSVGTAYAEHETAEQTFAFVPGGRFILDTEPNPEPLWGTGGDVLWASDEALIIAGGQGVGKTTLGQQLALGRCGFDEYATLLGFPILPGARRTLNLAMDRPRQASRSFRRMVGEAWRDELDARLVVWQGPPPSDMGRSTDLLLDLCEQADADTVIVDSLKDAALGLIDDEVGAGYNRARQKATRGGVQVVELHHNRKTQQHATAATPSLDNVYGSTWLTSGTGSVLLLSGAPGDSIVALRHLKQPADEVGPLRIIHDHAVGSSRVVDGADLLALTREPVSAVDVARALYGTEKPTANEREKARRKLDRGVAEGLFEIAQHGDRTFSRPTLWVAK